MNLRDSPDRGILATPLFSTLTERPVLIWDLIYFYLQQITLEVLFPQRQVLDRLNIWCQASINLNIEYLCKTNQILITN